MFYLVPSAYEKCLLWITRTSVSVGCVLHQESTCNTRHVELPFTLPKDVSCIILECDLIEARDGGVAFLHLNDILEYQESTKKAEPISEPSSCWYMRRREMLQEYYLRNFTQDSASSEFRVLLPKLYPAQDITLLYNLVLPNSYGLIRGFRLMDNKRSIVKRYDVRKCTLHKSHLPDVYTVQSSPLQIPGNNIAYIANAGEAAKVAKLFDSTSTSVDVDCEYLPMRQKWSPIV